MGGSDDPSNIEELTIEEHAEAHRILYEQHGKAEDRAAWLGLSGQTEAMMRIICSIAGHRGKKTLKAWHDKCRGSTYEIIYGLERAVELRDIRRQKMSGKNNPMYGTTHSEQWRQGHSERMSGKNHFNHGKPAFTRGRVWVNDGSKSRMVSKDSIQDLLSQGWVLGRRLAP